MATAPDSPSEPQDQAENQAKAQTETPRLSRSDQRALTRSRILEAALALIVEEGMRAVRHRAVADRAGVALGSTTYHFASIEELIISTFEYWRSSRQLVDNPFYVTTVELLAPYADGPVPPAERKPLADRVLALSVDYLIDQVCEHRQDRIVELAFHHESMRYPALRELVIQGWQAQQAFLQHIHAQLGSASAAEDALLTSLVFRQWEQTAVMQDEQALDVLAMARSLHRHMSLCFGEPLARPAAMTEA